MGQFATLKKYLFVLPLVCSVGLFAPLASAQEQTTELQNIINQIEDAANQQDLEKIMEFYSQEFTNSDGLRYDSVSDALQQLWENYANLNYTIELESWEKTGDELVAETLTKITGVKFINEQSINMVSTIRSRQYFQDNKLIRQEIISEETKLSSGNSPHIQVNVPEVAKVREQFNFDVIVEDPLDNDLLLGSAIEEQTASNRYLNPTDFELEPLPSGGVFKRVTAPGLPGSYWLSAIIIKGDGMIIVTRRVTIE